MKRDQGTHGHPETAGEPAYVLQTLDDIAVSDLLERFEGLTFPPIDRRVDARQLDGRLLGATVLDEEGPVGLAVAQVPEAHSGAQEGQVPDARGAARLLSLFVLPEARRRGLASRLLAASELVLTQAGVAEVEALYRTSWASLVAIERLFDDAGWSPPETRFLIGRGSRDSLAGIGDLASLRLPEGAEIFAWQQLTDAERRELEDSRGEQRWYPENLWPLQMAARIEPEISVGLRHRGALAGWMIVHRLAHDTVQYSALFVRDHLRRTGAARALVAAAIERRLRSPHIRHGVFLVDVRNREMRRFAEGPLRPLLTSWVELRVVRRSLP